MAPGTTDYEFVIVGAGVSGLTLTHLLADELQPSTPVLLVDKDDDPDYNISFWAERDTPFASIIPRRWRKIAVRLGDREAVSSLSRYRLRAFWRDEFDALLHERLIQHPNVHLQDAAVTEVVETDSNVEVETTAGRVRAKWVFDSRASIAQIRRDDPELMLMQGLAVEIESEAPTFDPEVATLFDFLLDSPQFDFMYVLPYSERSALVNVAYVTPYSRSVGEATCEQAIDRYVTERLQCRRYQVTKRCFGRIPLASRFPERQPGSRVVPIGVRSGIIKASTSYAFTRILEDSQQIVETIRSTGQPYYRKKRPWYYRGTGKATSKAFHSAPGVAQELMFSMFTPDNGDLALAFLDEKNSLTENLTVFRSIPPPTIARFLWQLAVGSLN